MALYDPRPARTLIRLHEQLPYPYLCEFGGAALRVESGVFCPTLTNASPMLLSCVDFRSGERVLDVFSGTGAFGIVAAMRGSRAVTVDKSPVAVACAADNAWRNGVAAVVDVRLGDVTAPPGGNGLGAGDRFDLVIANPPLLPGEPRGALGAALFDPGLVATRALIALLPNYLARGGRCYLITSDVLERLGMRVERLCAANGLFASLAAAWDLGYERYRVHRIVRGRPPWW
jgi:methylase of polypeptide subunit release factors